MISKRLNIAIVLFLISFFCDGQQTMGLFINQPESYNGYTLFSNNGSSYLIDNCGYKVNSWESEYKTGHGIYLTPSGQLLRAGLLSGSFNAGGRGGIVELYNWSGNKLWEGYFADEQMHAHHDLELLPNDNFLITIWEKHSEEEAKKKGRKYSGTVWSEKIQEIKILSNNNYEIVWEWSTWDHLIQDFDPTKDNFGVINENPHRFDINFLGEPSSDPANWIHINAIDYNEQFDQIAISSRNLSEIYIIDHSTSNAESKSSTGGRYGRGGDLLFRYGNPQAYQKGTIQDQILNKQHDIKWVDDFTFSIFNNEYIPNSQSQALIFKSPAQLDGSFTYNETDLFGEIEVLFSYTQIGFYSSIMSSIQVLPNDNILILEGESGHLFEITPNKDIVWDYINPANRNGGSGIQGGEPRFNSLFRAHRYPVSYSGFENKDLTPSVQVELSPNDSDCEINQNTSATDAINSNKTYRVNLKTNPASEYLTIDNQSGSSLEIRILDLLGTEFISDTIDSGINEIEATNLFTGTYVIQYLHADGRRHAELFIFL